MNTKALNEKLLKFAEIEYKIHTIDCKGETYLRIDTTGYFLKSKLIRKSAPDLVHDLNAQVKYLYPKLIQSGWEFELRYIKENEVSNLPFKPCYFAYLILEPRSPILTKQDINIKAEANNPSLAFALVVEKYIDSLK